MYREVVNAVIIPTFVLQQFVSVEKHQPSDFIHFSSVKIIWKTRFLFQDAKTGRKASSYKMMKIRNLLDVLSVTSQTENNSNVIGWPMLLKSVSLRVSTVKAEIKCYGLRRGHSIPAEWILFLLVCLFSTKTSTYNMSQRLDRAFVDFYKQSYQSLMAKLVGILKELVRFELSLAEKENRTHVLNADKLILNRARCVKKYYYR